MDYQLKMVARKQDIYPIHEVIKPIEQNYYTLERTSLAIPHALQEWGPYLQESKFIIYTDNHLLKFVYLKMLDLKASKMSIVYSRFQL